jgi:opacity protein-like surface antigen
MPLLLLFLGLVIATPLAAPATAETAAESADAVRERDDRIADLERKLDLVVDELATVRDQVAVPEDRDLKPAYGFGPAASKIYGADRGLSIGGYGEWFYRSFVGNDDSGSDSVGGVSISDRQLDRADALRLVTYIGYKFSDSIVFNSEIEYEHAFIGEDTVSAPSGEVRVEFAALDFFWREEVNARAGVLLLPMGFLNEVHEPPFYYGVSRPETETRILPTTWSEMGAGLFGELGEQVEYRAYLVNGFNARGFTDAGIRDGRQNANRALAEDVAVVGRLDWRPTEAWMIGGSLYYGDSGQDQTLSGIDIPGAALLVAEGHVQWRYEQWQARALFAYNQLSDARDLNVALGRALNRPIAEQMLGGYVEIAYDVWPLFFESLDRSLAPFLRIEYVDTQYDVPSGFTANDRNRYWVYTPGLQFKPHPNVALKLEYRNFSPRGGERPDEISLGMGFAF